jgi:SAM-dependent methyltransferase
LAHRPIIGLPATSADFVWGEDAWCYIPDKANLIGEAVHLLKPGGCIAFTDWVEGPAGLSNAQADRFLRFMKFPNLQDITGYARLLQDSGCTVMAAEDTSRFPSYVDLYLNMLDMQLTYNALRIIGFDTALMRTIADDLAFMRKLAHGGNITQGRFIARRQ